MLNSDFTDINSSRKGGGDTRARNVEIQQPRSSIPSSKSTSQDLSEDQSGGIIKIPISLPAGQRRENGSVGGHAKIKWERGVNAIFHFTCHAYIVPTIPEPVDTSKDVKEDKEGHHHNHEDPSHHNDKNHADSTSSGHSHGSHAQHIHKHNSSCGCGSKDAQQKKMELIQDLLSGKLAAEKNEAEKKAKKVSSVKGASEEDGETQKKEEIPKKNQLPPKRTLISDTRKGVPEITALLPGSPKKEGEPFELRIGYSFSVPALETCVKSMVVGEKARFLCMPSYCEGFIPLETVLRQQTYNNTLIAQGKAPLNFSGCSAHMSREMMDLGQGLEDAIGVPLEFELELLRVQMANSFVKEPWEMTTQEKFDEIPGRKDEGALAYKKGDWQGALKKYERCLVLLESLLSSGLVLDMKKEEMDLKRGIHSPSILPESAKSISLPRIEEWNRACRLNFSACHLKLGDFRAVIIQTSEILRTEPGCVKALFRRGQAYMSLGRDLDLAQADFLTLSKIIEKGSQEETELQVQREALKMKLKRHAEKEKLMFSGKLLG